jgi:hypothetical protein
MLLIVREYTLSSLCEQKVDRGEKHNKHCAPIVSGSRFIRDTYDDAPGQTDEDLQVGTTTLSEDGIEIKINSNSCTGVNVSNLCLFSNVE